MGLQRVVKIQGMLSGPLLVKSPENIKYLAGSAFNGNDGWLLVAKHQTVLFGSGLEKKRGKFKADSFSDLDKYLENEKILNIEDGFTYGEGAYLKRKLKKEKIVPLASPVGKARQIKDGAEIALMRRSMEIVKLVFAQVKTVLKKKTWTELELAKFIGGAGIKAGAEDLSFPVIVAGGANAAVPHHAPSVKKLKAGESIVIDFGFKYKGYVSDFTRTVFLKSAPHKLAMAYRQTEAAYNNSVALINSRPNIAAAEVHNAAVQTLKQKHLEKYFIHSLGHGSGLAVHEPPSLSPASKDRLADGMVFSIEPGVYFPRLGGVRIEDLFYIKNGKCKKFINVPTDLENNII